MATDTMGQVPSEAVVKLPNIDICPWIVGIWDRSVKDIQAEEMIL